MLSFFWTFKSIEMYSRLEACTLVDSWESCIFPRLASVLAWFYLDIFWLISMTKSYQELRQLIQIFFAVKEYRSIRFELRSDVSGIFTDNVFLLATFRVSNMWYFIYDLYFSRNNDNEKQRWNNGNKLQAFTSILARNFTHLI